MNAVQGDETKLMKMLEEKGVAGGFMEGTFVNAGKLGAAMGYVLATTAGRNYHKPRRCYLCGREYTFPDQAWHGSQNALAYHSANNTCNECGYQAVKRAHRIPDKYLAASLGDFPAFSSADKEVFLGSDLWVQGPIGAGKTHFMFAVMNRLLLGDAKGLAYVEFHALTRSLRAAYKGPEWQTEEQIINKWAGVRVLFVDDVFGTRAEEKPMDDENHALYTLVGARYSAQRRTYFTSNYTPGDLEAKGFNPRTVSRIRERCIEVPLTGADRRREGAA